MKQTAVEWFYIEMENLRVKAEITNMDGNDFIISKVKLLQQAKEMEQEQIMDAYWDGNQDVGYKLLAEQYYQKTFKS
tara:strand:- start:350 stop:580 length:231 start_codon:yes stop_codon:yes gene_type:complete